VGSVRRRRILETALCTLFFVLAGWQVIGPVPTGLPDNGDFAKVLSAMKVGPAPGTEAALANRYFSPDYVIQERFFWNAELPTSEYWVAKAAKRYAKWFLPDGRFDLRILGVLHALILGCALWLFLRSYRSDPFGIQVAAGLLLVFIFSDIEYVQFFSTPYADAAAIVFFCLFAAVALNVWRRRQTVSFWWVSAFAASGCLFLTSKLQHQLDVIPLCALAVLIALQSQSRRARAYFVLPVITFVAATCFMSMKTRGDYRADPIYAMVFTRLAGHSSHPLQILREFGIPSSYRQYVGTLPFQNGYLLDNPAQREFFVQTVDLGKVAGFYARHPGTAIHWLVNDLKEFAPDVNLKRWGVHRFRIADFEQHQADRRFTWWSSLRGAIQDQFWLFVPLLYAGALAVSFLAAIQTNVSRVFRSWPVLAAIAVVGAFTFAVSSLNDCIETARHIIVFQVATDLTIFLLLFDLVTYWRSRRAYGRSPAAVDEAVPTAAGQTVVSSSAPPSV
jgi:hypothetical protein